MATTTLDIAALRAATCSTCSGTGLIDWLPAQQRNSDQDQQPCPDGCDVPPNEVVVDKDWCSCPGYCRACRRSDADVACPVHGEPLQHGDGDVLVVHPEGTSLIREPAAADEAVSA